MKRKMIIKKWKYIVCLIFLKAAIITSCQSTTLHDVVELQGFEKEVDSIMNVYHTVGAAIAVLKDGKVIYKKGFGYKDLEKKDTVNSTTVFGIGSCTKAFTAALFDIFEQKGLVQLKDSPKTYIPELSFYNDTMDEHIKISDILSHRTGIPNIPTESSAVFFRSDDRNAIIPRLKYIEPQADVGETWIYNNYLYALAGRITERITKQDWEDNLAEYIFTPLEMNTTYANVVTASKDPNFALGYGVSRRDTIPMQVLPENFPTRDAGGNIYSSIDDMTKWLKVWMSQGYYKKQRVLSSKYIKEATGNQQLINTDSITQQSQYYGYGWMNSMQKGYRKIEHSGGISGYTSNVVYYPDKQLGIIVLTNQNTAGTAFAITDRISERFLDIAIETGSNEPYFSTVISLEDPKTPTTINQTDPPTHSLVDLSGTYHHSGFGDIKVYLEEETLYAKVPFTTFRLSHEAGNRFQDHFTERKSQVVGNFLNFTFQVNEQNIIHGILLNISEAGILFEKID
ncbi:serine hydrolase [Aquimarina sp. SS2-1]|uniref:serine hydrolase n=1 Tax=Aquimarina besae TaxID=3342247 RepID=UPI00366B6FE0